MAWKKLQINNSSHCRFVFDPSWITSTKLYFFLSSSLNESLSAWVLGTKQSTLRLCSDLPFKYWNGINSSSLKRTTFIQNRSCVKILAISTIFFKPYPNILYTTSAEIDIHQNCNIGNLQLQIIPANQNKSRPRQITNDQEQLCSLVIF